MNSQLEIIPDELLSHISGGHIGAIGWFSITIFMLELPHIFMGIREFTNYVGERYHDGCQNVDENDYFTRFFCG